MPYLDEEPNGAKSAWIPGWTVDGNNGFALISLAGRTMTNEQQKVLQDLPDDGDIYVHPFE